jgi:hypothetical protein
VNALVTKLSRPLLCKQGVGGSSPLVSTDETTGRCVVLRDDVIEVRFFTQQVARARGLITL